MIDLHLHTTHSDGRWAPRRVVEEAAARGLAAIAITDHDVLDGLAEARAAAAELGVELVDGIELTADWDGRAVHILGYGVDPHDAALQAALRRGRALMAEHVDRVLAAIQAAGQRLSGEDLARYNTRYPTGTSLVLGMLEHGILRGSSRARQLLALASREPRAYTAREAIALIQGAGGVAVLAHPGRLSRRGARLTEDGLQPLLEAGLDGVEVWHVSHDQETREHYLRLGRALNLLVTGGSDCHGPRSTGVRIGNQRVPSEILTALRRRLAERRAPRVPA